MNNSNTSKSSYSSYSNNSYNLSSKSSNSSSNYLSSNSNHFSSSVKSPLKGDAAQIVSVTDTGIVYHDVEMRKILNKFVHPILIYSIIGKYREGKSLLMNLFLLFNQLITDGKDWTRLDCIIDGNQTPIITH